MIKKISKKEYNLQLKKDLLKYRKLMKIFNEKRAILAKNFQLKNEKKKLLKGGFKNEDTMWQFKKEIELRMSKLKSKRLKKWPAFEKARDYNNVNNIQVAEYGMRGKIGVSRVSADQQWKNIEYKKAMRNFTKIADEYSKKGVHLNPNYIFFKRIKVENSFGEIKVVDYDNNLTANWMFKKFSNHIEYDKKEFKENLVVVKEINRRLKMLLKSENVVVLNRAMNGRLNLNVDVIAYSNENEFRTLKNKDGSVKLDKNGDYKKKFYHQFENSKYRKNFVGNLKKFNVGSNSYFGFEDNGAYIIIGKNDSFKVQFFDSDHTKLRNIVVENEDYDEQDLNELENYVTNPEIDTRYYDPKPILNLLQQNLNAKNAMKWGT